MKTRLPPIPRMSLTHAFSASAPSREQTCGRPFVGAAWYSYGNEKL